MLLGAEFTISFCVNHCSDVSHDVLNLNLMIHYCIRYRYLLLIQKYTIQTYNI